MKDWCILRCAASRTIPLAHALNEAGFDAWTPVETVKVRTGNKDRALVKQARAITPTFVFAAYDRLGDLRRLVQSPAQCWQVWDAELRRMVMRGIPHFSLFRFDGQFPRLADRALEPLRRFERQRLPRVASAVFKAGQSVRLAGSGFDGLIGIVEGARGRMVKVAIPGWPILLEVHPGRLELNEDRPTESDCHLQVTGRVDEMDAFNCGMAAASNENIEQAKVIASASN